MSMLLDGGIPTLTTGLLDGGIPTSASTGTIDGGTPTDPTAAASSSRYPFGQTVTVIRAGGVDEYGDPIADGTRTDIDGCAVAPRSSADIGGDRLGVIVGLTVYFPDGTTIDPTDRFEIDGVLYQLDGVAGVWVSPFTGWRPGVEVALTRAAG